MDIATSMDYDDLVVVVTCLTGSISGQKNADDVIPADASLHQATYENKTFNG